MSHYTFFQTPIGRCGLVWGANGLLGVLLPAEDAGAATARLRRVWPEASAAEPPDHVHEAMAATIGLLSGTSADDLTGVVLDMRRLPVFQRRVYAMARGILPGCTTTYGEIAGRLGEPGSARAVGQALGANPFPLIVPCHRVLAANGRSGGFSAPGGLRTKLRLLEIERASLGGLPGLFD
jgi:methylated-DNA-[protein]-cysteine S-methyltransferase